MNVCLYIGWISSDYLPKIEVNGFALLWTVPYVGSRNPKKHDDMRGQTPVDSKLHGGIMMKFTSTVDHNQFLDKAVGMDSFGHGQTADWKGVYSPCIPHTRNGYTLCTVLEVSVAIRFILAFCMGEHAQINVSSHMISVLTNWAILHQNTHLYMNNKKKLENLPSILHDIKPHGSMMIKSCAFFMWYIVEDHRNSPITAKTICYKAKFHNLECCSIVDFFIQIIKYQHISI